MRILPVGFDSSDGSSAGASAEGNVLFGAAPWQWHPEGTCAQAAFGELGGTQGRDSTVPNTLWLGESPEGTTAKRWGRIPVPVWGFWSCPQMQLGLSAVAGDGDDGASSPAHYGLRSQVCSSSWCKAATATLQQEASVKVRVQKWCGEEKKCDKI